MNEFLWIVLVFFLGGSIQGIMGFGFAVATTLLLVNRMDLTLLVFMNISMSTLTSGIALFSSDNLRSINKKLLLLLVLTAFMGLILGMLLIDHAVDALLRKITLTAILLASVLSLTKTKKLFARPFMLWINGFLSGALTPSTGINGPFVALCLNASFTDKRVIRSTMLAYLFIIMVVGLFSMYLFGKVPAGTWNTMAKVTAPSLLGYLGGMWLFARLSHIYYQKMVIAFLITSSLVSLVYLIT